MDLFIYSREINLLKELGATKEIKKLIDEEKRVPVLGCHFIQGALFREKAKAPVLLCHKKTRRLRMIT